MKTLVALVMVLTLVAATRGGEDAALGTRLVSAARQQIGVTKEYDPGYKALKYPGGDVPLYTGVLKYQVIGHYRLKEATQIGPANGSKPIRAETNRTSQAAASRR